MTLTVFVHLMKNEYSTLPFDYVADPLMEIGTFFQVIKVDGVVTEFPGTASRFLCKSHSLRAINAIQGAHVAILTHLHREDLYFHK